MSKNPKIKSLTAVIVFISLLFVEGSQMNTKNISVETFLKKKHRTIVNTDGEVDDIDLFVRYLHLGNELATESTVEIPTDADSGTVHVIFEVTDTRSPELSRYQITIIEIEA